MPRKCPQKTVGIRETVYAEVLKYAKAQKPQLWIGEVLELAWRKFIEKKQELA